MSIFNELDYIEALRKEQSRAKTIDRRKSLSRMAAAVRVQQPYLSKVFSGKANLSSDQLYRCCEFLGLGADERSYLLLLRERSKCGIPKRREDLDLQIASIQKKKLDTSNYVKAKTLDVRELGQTEYYLDPILQLIHVGLTIKEFKKSPELLASELRISKEKFFIALRKLIDLNLVSHTERGYETTQTQLHLPKDSPVYQAWKGLTRQLIIERLYRSSNSETYNFSVVFSANERIRKIMQTRLLELIKEFESLVRDIEPTQVFQFSVDLFPWTTADSK